MAVIDVAIPTSQFANTTIDAGPGDIINIPAGMRGNITINGGPDVTVNILGDPDPGSTFGQLTLGGFGSDIEPTVNIPAGVDFSRYPIDSNGENLTLNVGDGATIAGIDATGMSNTGTLTINAGNDVTVDGSVSNFGADADITFGSGAEVTGTFQATQQGDATVDFGDNATFGGNVILSNGSTADVNATFGDGLDLTGQLTAGNGGSEMNIAIGNDATITNTLNLTGSAPTNLTIGDNATLLGNINMASSDDTVVIGDNWDLANINMNLGDDNVTIGQQAVGSGNTLIDGGNPNGADTDGITITPRPDQVAAFESAGWVDNGDGTFSSPPAAFNGGQVTAPGVTVRDFEGAAAPIETANEAPVLGPIADPTIDENSTGPVFTAAATDPEGGPIAYSLAGDDAALFAIDPTTGEVTPVNPLDFETPADANGNNIYDITVVATDPEGATAEEPVAITVADVAEGGTPNQIVDGENIDEVMNPGYNDAAGATDSGGDIIDGADGDNDVILGNGGNDTINAGLGTDEVYGGSGDDSIAGGDGNDTISGDFSDSVSDVVVDDSSLSGNDTIDGGAGEDLIYGDFTPDFNSTTTTPGEFLSGSTAEQVNQFTTGFQSPPITTVLDNGQVVYTWIDNGTTDDNLDMDVQMRIAEADGTWATDQVELSEIWAVDGFDAFDWANMDVDTLPDGNLVVSYVRNTREDGTDVNEPVFSIIDPSALGTPQQYVVTNQEIQQTDPGVYESPPVTTVLDDGNILFVWSENAIADDQTTMVLNGRIFDTQSNTFGTEFPVGVDASGDQIAIDGLNTADVPNLDVNQLADGNVLVSYVLNTAEVGENEPIFTILDSDGNTVKEITQMQETDTTLYESPPQVVALEDGGFMGVWVNNGYSDDTNTMQLEGRIFDAAGNPLTGDIDLTGDGFSVDGWNSYDIPSFTIDTLPGTDKVVVSYVNGSVNDGGIGVDNASDKSHFSILDVSDPENPTFVAQDVQIPVDPDHPYSGPALIEPLGDTGAFVAVYGDGNAAASGAYGLNFRIFDENGNPLTDDVQLVTTADTEAVSGLDNFDWDNVDVDYNAANDTFTVNWVGVNDGSNTGVFTSGPIAGVSGGTGGSVTPTGPQGDDVIDGGTGADTIFGNGGDDTIDGGSEDDIIYGDNATGLGGGGTTTTAGEFLSGSTAEQVNQFTTGFQSPPITTVLDNGQVVYTWIDNGTTDDNLDMDVQMRIAEADGTWATDQVELSEIWAVDGFDAFDWANMDVDTLPDGNLVVSYVRNTREDGTDVNEPVFSIIDPSALGTPQQYVVTNQEIQQTDPGVYESPPVTTVLDDGNILFVWSENAIADDQTTMVLNGRIFDTQSNTFGTEFPVGVDASGDQIAIDGLNTADVPNLDVNQLADGNVLVSYVLNTAEVGENEPIFTILDSDGNTVKEITQMQETDTTLYESPPQVVALEDGGFMGVWVNNGYSDDTNTMQLEGRIFDAAGNPLTGDIDLTGDGFSVDGWNSYDIPSFTIDTLPGTDKVVVSYVNGSVNDGGIGVDNASDKSHFSILDVSDPENPTFVAQDVQIPVDPDHPYSGPALIEPLGDTGAFVAVYGDGNAAASGAYGLNFRIFDENGNPLTDDVQLVTTADTEAVSGLDNFDWDNVDVDYNAANDTFTVNWVGVNDGSNTGVFTSGPIAGVSGNSGGTGDTVAGGDGGDDVITGGIGADTLFGEGGNDTFLVGSGAEGNGDVIDGGNGPDETTDLDVLDLTGAGAVVINDAADANDDGATAGTVTFDDGSTLTFEGIEQIITDPEDQAPVLDPIGAQDVPENSTDPVFTANAVDPDGEAPIYSLSGDDAALFNIDPATGVVTPVAPLDFENPTDDNGDGIYDITVVATDPTDPTLFDEEPVSITVGDVNEAPDVTGPAAVDAPENATDPIATYATTDPEGQPVTLTLAGDDAALFEIDQATGELSPIAPLDFENPTDTDGDGVYDVTVVATDPGGLTDEQPVAVTVTDVPEPDGVVDGTEAGEFMLPGYVDAQGDIIDGADGLDDSILGNGGEDFIRAGEGNDTVDGGTGFDEIFGDAGDDLLSSGEGNDIDVIFGGDGNDTLIGNDGIDDLNGDAGDDVIDGGADDDLLRGNAGNDLVDGGIGNDTINGDDGNDTLNGGDGNDVIDAGEGEDSITGGDGDDQIFGADGTDTLVGGDGADTMFGQFGDDDIVVGAGDTAEGQQGDDVFTVDPTLTGADPITIVGGEDFEETDFDASNNPDGRLGDVLDLRGLDDVVVVYDETDPTFDPVTGESESGTATYTNAAGDPVTINFSEIENILVDVVPDGAVDGLDDPEVMAPGYVDAQGDEIDGADGLDDAIDGNGGDDTIDAGLGNDTVSGGEGDDVVDGNVGDDVLAGDAGNDTLDGGEGNDVLDGGDDADTLTGGEGDDTLDGGAGDDDIAVGGGDEALGGSGDDVFTVDPTDTNPDVNVTIDGGTDGTVLGEEAGPENGDAGDVLDLGDQTGNLDVTLGTDPETGVVNGLDDDLATDITFDEIEAVVTGSGDDTVDGGLSTGPIDVDTGEGNDDVLGGAGDDTIDAGEGDDTVDGGAGDDSIVAGPGNDVIDGGDGNDTIDGGGDDDEIDGGAGDDSIAGGDGTDTLAGGEGADTLDGGADDDDIKVGAGDTALGGDGDDEFLVDPSLTGTDPITITGGEAGEDLTDPTNGGDGDTLDLTNLDVVSITYDETDPTFDPVTGVGESGTVVYNNDAGDPVTINFSEIENVLANPIPDGVVDGAETPEVMEPGFVDPQGDEIDGADGLDDAIDGNGGDDIIDAGLGNDTVSGGEGDDVVDGNVGDDVLAGDAGNDTLDGGEGNDVLDGGDDADTLTGGEGDDTLDGGAGDDDIAVGGGDEALGGSGDDVFTVDPTDTNPDVNVTIDGGTDGTVLGEEAGPENGDAGDVLDLGDQTGNLDVTLGTDPETGVVNGLDDDLATDITFDEIEAVVTGSGDDTVDGGLSTGPIDVDTGEGNDDVLGGAGDDTIDTGEGDDTVDGGAGDDSIAAGPGNDTVDGGAGNDTIDAGEGDDTVDGGAGDDSIAAGPGNDTIDGGDGNDTIDGGGDDDLIDGGAGDDSILGGDGTDTLAGGEGADTLDGGAGDDDITVGAGDTGLGGGGDDVFTVDPTLAGATAISVDGGDDATSDPTDPAGPENGDAGDVLDLTGLTNVSQLGEIVDDGTGSLTGAVTYENDAGETVTLNFTEIENVIGLPPAPDINVIYLGNFADVDPIEGTFNSENGGDLVGESADFTVLQNTGLAFTNTVGSPDVINDNDGGTGDSVTYNVGAGPVTAEADSSLVGEVELTLTDGTTQTLDVVFLQTDNGDLFISDLNNGGTLDDLDIANVEVTSITGTNFSGFVADQTVTNTTFGPVDLTDGVVDGAETPEAMVPGFVDPQGDEIDGADGLDDAIDGNGGDDTIDAGLGNDTVSGGEGDDVVDGNVGDDVLAGDAGNDTLDGGEGNDVLDGGDDADTLTGGEGDDTLDGGAGDDDIAVGGGDEALGGSGDDVFTVDPTDTNPDTNVTIDGGTDGTVPGEEAGPENGDAGDVLDLGDQTGNLDVVLGTDPESGTVDGIDTIAGDTDITFDEIEAVVTGSGDDTVDGGLATGPIDVDTGEGTDDVLGGAGNDTIDTGEGDDTVDGGAGDDSIAAGPGNDTVDGGDGNDTIDAGEGDDTVDGGAGDDSIAAGPGNDTIDGGDGNDTIDGGGDDDLIDGGAGDDSILGGAGTDTLTGGEGADTLDGGAGDDDITVGAGDTALGGDGDDEFLVDPTLTGTDPITITGGEAGEDLTDPTNGGDGDTLDLTNLDVVSITYDETDPTFDPVTGVGESGTVVYNNDAGDPVTINFSEIENVLADPLPDGVVDGEETGEDMGLGYDDSNAPTDGGGDVITTGDDTIAGNGGDDTIDGDAGNDVIDGGADDDLIDGGIGNDEIIGGEGDDSLTGSEGDDTLTGNDGADVIDGDEGNDLINAGPEDTNQPNGADGGASGALPIEEYDNAYAGGDGDDTIVGGDGDDIITGDDDSRVSAANGTPFDPAADGSDSILGGAGNDEIHTGSWADGDDGLGNEVTGVVGDFADGEEGDDILIGAGGDDTLRGSEGDDTINAGAGNDDIDGGDDNDIINAGDGDDTVLGGAGTDTLTGGEGADTLDGGAGDDDITVGAGDTALGGDGDDEFLVDPTLAGTDPITITGGEAGEDLTDPTNGGDGDTLDLTNLDVVSITYDETDPTFDPVTGVGESGTVVYNNDAGDPVTINFSEIENVLADPLPDGVVDGEETGEFMGVGYDDSNAPTDGGGDLITNGDDSIEGNGGDDTINAGAGNDTVDGGADNDSIQAGDGDDFATGGAGDDTLSGGIGSDTIEGGIGDDVLSGGAGDDSVSGGDGADDILSGSGDDTIDGGLGNDTVDAGTGADEITDLDGDNLINSDNPGSFNPDVGTPIIPRDPTDPTIPGDPTAPIPVSPVDGDTTDNSDTITTGVGNDTIVSGDDADVIDAGDGDNVIDGGTDGDTITTGAGADSIMGGEGNDLIDAGDGNDTIDGGVGFDVVNVIDEPNAGFTADPLPNVNGDDTINAGGGDDVVMGEDDDDLIDGGDGNDTLDGGIDDDTITGGAGDDVIIGGQGADSLDGGLGDDTFTVGTYTDPRGTGEYKEGLDDTIVGGEDGDGADIDVLDLSGSGPLLVDYDETDPTFDPVTGTSESGTVIFYTDDTQTTEAGRLSFSEIEEVIPCFTPGTLIATSKGEKPVEDLKAGDRVITRDNGFQEIAWVGAKQMTGFEFAQRPELKPVFVKAGSFGEGLPERDMMLSPNHKVLLASDQAELHFEDREVLVAAKHMVGMDGISRVDVAETSYIHFMFERHEIVLSDGAWSESFHPGDYSINGIDEDARREILALFPELDTTAGLKDYRMARTELKKHEARLLLP